MEAANTGAGIDIFDALKAEYKLLYPGKFDDIPSSKDPETVAALTAEMFRRVHALDGLDEPTALCLSGGGVRSATYCLGVLQGLARKRLLGRFHYLSTVSGGGYIGSWLSRWIEHTSFAEVEKTLASSGRPGAVEPVPVRHLRSFSSYLSPTWGLSTDFLALVATFARNLVLHWAVFLPLLMAVLSTPRLYLAALQAQSQERIAPWGPLAAMLLAAFLVGLVISYVSADLPGQRPDRDPPDQFRLFALLPLLAAATAMSLAFYWVSPQRLEAFSAPLCGCLPAISKENQGLLNAALAGAAVHVLAVLAGMVWRTFRGLALRQYALTAADQWLGFAAVVASGAVGGMLSYLGASFVAAHVASLQTPQTEEFLLLYGALAVPVLLFVFWIALTLFVGISRRLTSENDREWWARASAHWLGACVACLLLFMVVVYGPQWLLAADWLAEHPSGSVGLAAVLGVVTSAIGYWSKNGATIRKHAQTLTAALGTRLLDLMALVFIVLLVVSLSWLFATFVLRADAVNEPPPKAAVQAPKTAVEVKLPERAPAEASAKGAPATPGAVKVTVALTVDAQTRGDKPAAEAGGRNAAADAYVAALLRMHWDLMASLILVLALCGWSMSKLIGVNTFSLHSMYGNRLVRAYLGAVRGDRKPHWFTGFDPDDNVDMKKLRPRNGRLFHVIGATLNLTRPAGGRLEWQQRKAAPFVFSPLHCGSPHLGFVPTGEYGGGDSGGGTSLARALTISGAAASPNMGYHTSTLVAFVMAFFNVRLGWWLPNPKFYRPDAPPRPIPPWRREEPANGLLPMLAEAGAMSSDTSSSVYLSDGGHFDNLGLYEMVRRRCRRIVVVDASCDPRYRHADLENTVRKIRVDLGIPVEFEEGLPTMERARRNGRRFCIGTIRYGEIDKGAPDGEIIYIKPVLVGDEPLDVLRYAQASKEVDKDSPFPHQPTSDQFFNESQFESYRMLGLHTILKIFPQGGAWPEPLQCKDDDSSGGGADVVPPEGFHTQESEWKPGSFEPVMQTMRDQILVSALAATVAGTVAGTIAVTGAVALKPEGAIELSEKDRALLREGIPLKWTGVPPEGEVNRAILAHIAALTKELGDLRGVLNQRAELKTISESLDKLSKATDELSKIERRINVHVDISTRVQASFDAAQESLVAITTQLQAIAQKMPAGPIQIPQPVQIQQPVKVELEPGLAAKLDAVQTHLQNISNAVREIPPRRNIRPLVDGVTQ